MSSQPTFQELLDRVRAGDQEAMTVLVRKYEPAVRRTVRVRLLDARLRRILDSSDVCQSVMKSLLNPAALQRYKLDTPDDLLKLLARMARNKLIRRVRKENAKKRTPGTPPPPTPPPPSPSSVVIARELFEKARGHLTAEEWTIWELQEQGLTLDEIAKQVGGTGESVRKKLERALKRVRRVIDSGSR
jgi:RNA polymerase sigma-70 factor (ECF subfamily)